MPSDIATCNTPPTTVRAELVGWRTDRSQSGV